MKVKNSINKMRRIDEDQPASFTFFFMDEDQPEWPKNYKRRTELGF